MTYRFFVIPAFDPAAAEAELNQVLAASRVLSVERQFVANGEASFWALCVSLAGAAGMDVPKTMDQTRHPAGAACRGGELQGARSAGRRNGQQPTPTALRAADSGALA